MTKQDEGLHQPHLILASSIHKQKGSDKRGRTPYDQHHFLWGENKWFVELVCSSLTLTLTILSYPSPHVACLSPMSGKGPRKGANFQELGYLPLAISKWQTWKCPEISWLGIYVFIFGWIFRRQTGCLVSSTTMTLATTTPWRWEIAKKFTSSFWLAAIVSRGPKNGMIWRVGECNHGPSSCLLLPALLCLPALRLD